MEGQIGDTDRQEKALVNVLLRLSIELALSLQRSVYINDAGVTEKPPCLPLWQL